MRKLGVVLLAAATLALAGCGGGGGGGGGTTTTAAPTPAITPVTTSTVGTYVLTELTQDMTNLATGARIVNISTPSTTPATTGTARLGSTSWQVTSNPLGSGSITTYGFYTFTNTSPTAGTFLITNTNGTAPETGTYTLIGATDITLVYAPEIVTANSVAYNVISTQKWRKVSDSI